MRQNSNLSHIVIHHGESPGTYGNYDSYREYHQSLGWREIAYDFLIDDGGSRATDHPEGTLSVCPRWWNIPKDVMHILPNRVAADETWQRIFLPKEHMDAAGAYQATSSGVSANRCGIHIVFCGNYDKKRPSTTMLMTGIEVVARLQSALWIPSGNILRHSDLAPKTCPGALFPFAEFKDRCIQRLSLLRNAMQLFENELDPPQPGEA